MRKKISYKDSGVDIDAAAEALRDLDRVSSMSRSEAVIHIPGSYGSLFALGELIGDYADPVLVQSVDGVGTKILIAREMDRYDTIGFDIVNHCLNDILCMGAKGLTFLDYIAVDRLKPSMVSELISSIALACAEAGVSLVGGETAEMPGVYMPNEFDIAGMVTGIVERSKIIDGRACSSGDLIVGLESSGLHTNGYSLARKILFERMGLQVDSEPDELEKSVGEVLLEPHRLYTKLIAPILEKEPIKGIAHITGGGFIDNIARIIPNRLDSLIEVKSWEPPPIFDLIARGGGIDADELYRVFNMGIGIALIIAPERLDALMNAFSERGERARLIGELKEGSGKARLV